MVDMHVVALKAGHVRAGHGFYFIAATENEAWWTRDDHTNLCQRQRTEHAPLLPPASSVHFLLFIICLVSTTYRHELQRLGERSG